MVERAKLESEMAAGRLWRAKEILQGPLRNAGYDPLRFEQYGRVLLHLGDMAESGIYLFLSGARNPEYREAIGSFMGRHAKSINTLRGFFLAAVRSADVSAYPERVLTELDAAGFPLSRLNKASHHAQCAASSWRNKAVGVDAFALFLLLVLGFVIQSFREFGWLVARIAGACPRPRNCPFRLAVQ
jgi:hypothetical protein